MKSGNIINFIALIVAALALIYTCTDKVPTKTLKSIDNNLRISTYSYKALTKQVLNQRSEITNLNSIATSNNNILGKVQGLLEKQDQEIANQAEQIKVLNNQNFRLGNMLGIEIKRNNQTLNFDRNRMTATLSNIHEEIVDMANPNSPNNTAFGIGEWERLLEKSLKRWRNHIQLELGSTFMQSNIGLSSDIKKISDRLKILLDRVGRVGNAEKCGKNTKATLMGLLRELEHVKIDQFLDFNPIERGEQIKELEAVDFTRC